MILLGLGVKAWQAATVGLAKNTPESICRITSHDVIYLSTQCSYYQSECNVVCLRFFFFLSKVGSWSVGAMNQASEGCKSQ